MEVERERIKLRAPGQIHHTIHSQISHQFTFLVTQIFQIPKLAQQNIFIFISDIYHFQLRMSQSPYPQHIHQQLSSPQQSSSIENQCDHLSENFNKIVQDVHNSESHHQISQEVHTHHEHGNCQHHHNLEILNYSPKQEHHQQSHVQIQMKKTEQSNQVRRQVHHQRSSHQVSFSPPPQNLSTAIRLQNQQNINQSFKQTTFKQPQTTLLPPPHQIPQQRYLHSSRVETKHPNFSLPPYQNPQPIPKPQSSMVYSTYQNQQNLNHSHNIYLNQQQYQPTQNPFVFRPAQNVHVRETRAHSHNQSPGMNTVVNRPQTFINQNTKQISHHSNSRDSKPMTPNVSFTFTSTQNNKVRRQQQQYRQIHPSPPAIHQQINSSQIQTRVIRNTHQEASQHSQYEQHLIKLHHKFSYIRHHYHLIWKQGQKVDYLFNQEKDEKLYNQIMMQYRLLMEELGELSTNLSELGSINQEFCSANNIHLDTLHVQIDRSEVMRHNISSVSANQLSNSEEVYKYQQKCAQLQQKLAYFADEYRKLDSEYHRLDSQYSTFQETYKKLETQYQRITHQLRQHSRPIQRGNSDDEVRRLTETIRQLEQQKAHIRSEFDREKRIISEYERNNEDMIHELQLKDKKIVQYRQTISYYESNQHTIGKNVDTTHLDKVINHQEILIKQLEEKLRDYHSDILGYKQMIDNLEGASKQNHHRLEEYQRTIKLLEIQNKDLINSYERVIEERNKFQRKFEDNIAKLTEQIKKNSVPNQVPHSEPRVIDNSQEISEYQQIIEKLKAQLRESNRQKITLEDSILNLEEIHNRMALQKDSEIRQLSEKIDFIQREMKLKIDDRQEVILKLEKKLRESQRPESAPIEKSIDMNSSSKISNLENTVTSLEQELFKKSQQITKMRHQVMGAEELKKQLTMVTQSLKSKNEQLFKYKQLQLKYNQINMEVELLKRQKSSMNDFSNEKDRQIEQLRRRMREVDNIPRKKNDSEQLQTMAEIIKRKDIQINKYRQEIQLKSTTIDELEYQIEKLKKKISQNDRQVQHEKEQYEDRVQYFQRRIKQLENRNKNYDSQHENDISSLEVQIAKLQDSIREKDIKINKITVDITNFKNQIRDLDSELQQTRNQKERISKMYQQMEIQYSEITVKLQSYESHRSKPEDYTAQIAQFQSALSLKDKKIKQLENSVETLKVKLNSSGPKSQQDFIAQQQIEVLKRKVIEYQSKITAYQKNSISTLKNTDYNSMYVFEQKVIYDLKTENQKLKKLLNGKGSSLTQLIPSKDSTAGNYNYIQRRLNEFNTKLETMITQNRKLEQTAEFGEYETMRSRQKVHLPNRDFERERIALIRTHRKEINEMQQWMIQLHKYCASIQSNENYSSGYQVTRNIDTKISVYDKAMSQQQLQYYKNINKQLQERIDFHLCLNRELKEKLEAYLNICSDPKQILFYKEQLATSENKICGLQQRIKKLTYKNEELEKQIEKLVQRIRSEDQSQHVTIEELQRQLALRNRQCDKLSEENNSNKLEISQLRAQISRLQEQIDKYQIRLSQIEDKYTHRISQLESELVNYANKINILQAQNERLTKQEGQLGQKYRNQIQLLNNKIKQMTEKIREFQRTISDCNNDIFRLEEANQGLSLAINSKNEEINQLQIINGSLGRKVNELQVKLRELTDEYDRKCFDYGQVETQNAALQINIRELERIVQELRKKLKSIQDDRTESNSQVQSLRNQISRLEKQIERLKSIIMEIQNQLQAHQNFKDELRYKLEYIRSTYIMIETVLAQLKIKKEQEQRIIYKKIVDSTEKGLQFCSLASSLL